jgi:hypothetical protein
MAALALAGASSASAAGGSAAGRGATRAPGSQTGASGAIAGGAQTTASGACTSSPTATSPTATATSGGAGMGPVPTVPTLPCARPTVPGLTAQIVHGVAYAPADAPVAVQEAIWAGDRIRLKPYRVGGGHGRWNDSAYDCSGTVSYVLHAAGLLKTSMDSSSLEGWGRRGLGQWITVYTNPGHAFIELAGIRLDTSAEGDPNPAPGSGPRWRPVMTSSAGFMARHPLGL